MLSYDYQEMRLEHRPLLKWLLEQPNKQSTVLHSKDYDAS